MTTVLAPRRRGNGSLMVLAVAVTLAGAAPLLLQLPRVDAIIPQAHAVERHGQDALKARRMLRVCPPENKRRKACPPGSAYGLSLAVWCETGTPLCPGAYTTIAGLEKTSFIRPCHQWKECK